MSFNALINSKSIQKSLIEKQKIFLFILPLDFNIQDVFNLRSFLNGQRLSLIKLPIKNLNRIFQTICLNEVIYNKYKKYDLKIFNFFFISVSDFLFLFFVMSYILNKFSNKINFLYLKINNLFITFSFLNSILKEAFFQNFVKKDLNLENYKKNLNLIVLKFYNLIKIIFFKFVFILKLFLFFVFQFNFYKIFIK